MLVRSEPSALCQAQPVEVHPCAVSPTDIHILLVDDEKLSRVVVSNLLRKCSYKVTVAESGVEAVQVLAKACPGTFHLILTDLMMPDVDGLDLLRYVRSHELLRELPVVMMSANGMYNTVFECLQGGAEEFLVKPVTKKEVQHIWTHVWKRVKNAQNPSAKLEIEGDGPGITGAPGKTLGSSSKSALQLKLQQPSLAALHRSGPQTASLNIQSIPFSGTLAVSRVAADHPAALIDRDETAARALQHKGRTDKVLLSRWLQRPNRVVDSKESLWIFCEVLLLLERFHAHSAEAVKVVRPSRLVLHNTGRVTIIPFAAAARMQSASGNPTQEEEWYSSPEEQQGAVGTVKSDMFSMGLLLFELFHVCANRPKALIELRQRVLPPGFVKHYPQEAGLTLALLNPDCSARPSVKDLICSDTFRTFCNSLRVRHQQLSQNEQLPESQVLLDFLKLMQQRKKAEAEKVNAHLTAVNKDIRYVSRSLQWLGSRRPAVEAVDEPVSKRQRCGETSEGTYQALSVSAPHQVSSSGEQTDPRWPRVSERFELFEDIFFEKRRAGADPPSPSSVPIEDADSLPPHLRDFSVDLCRFVQHERLQTLANLRYGETPSTTNMVCSVSFDRDDEYFAAAGVSKRIKIYELANVLDNAVGVHYPVLEINSRSRISSVCWSSYIKNHMASADYEGVVQLWDANNNTELFQYEEHAKRVWSVDFSRTDPTRLMSGSDDSTVKIWSINQEHSAMTINSKANVCSVQFSPTSSNIIAFGSANYQVYLYDLRNTTTPLATIAGHSKAVSYVRFVTGNLLASASIDNTVKLWDLSKLESSGDYSCAAVFTGHTNEKNFVGLSVTSDGYVACGSETNEVFCYYKAMGFPVTSYSINSSEYPPLSPSEYVDPHAQFVSTVCWARNSKVLLAANSVGDIRVLELV